MNFLQLKYFVAVCEFGTVSAAANYLHIAQPSLSLAIKELEEEFGALLFHRRHKGMAPTEEGELLLGMARDILERAEAAERIMKDVGENKKTLKIGIPPMIASLILPTLYKDFVSENPDITLDITEGGREELVKMVEDDRLDLAFISHSKLPDGELEFLHIDTLNIVCAASGESPVSKKREVSPSDLKDVPVVMYKDGFFQSGEIKSWFSSKGIEPKILMKTNQLSTMTKIISSNTAIGFLFEKLIEKESGLTEVKLSPCITAEISLIWKKKNFSVTGIKRLKAFLKNTNIFR